MKVKLLTLFLTVNLSALAQPRQETILTEGWRFSQDKQTWKLVRVPHDWAIAGPFDKKWDLQTVAIEQNGETEATEKSGRSGALPWIGEGYYKRTITIPEGCTHAELLFDGAMAEPRIYLNGAFVGEWAYGYNSFRVDISGTMKAGDTLKVNFTALRAEAGLAQIFSIKSLPESSVARIEPTLNGTALGERRVAAGAHVFWPVTTNLVVEGANELVLKRKDSGTGDFGFDAMELGGSLGVGSASHVINDGRVYPEQIATGVPSAADPNPAHWAVGFRPYLDNTNLNFNVWVDPEIVGACTSRFWTCVQCAKSPGSTSVPKSSHFTIFVNEEAMTNIYADASWVDIPLDFNPGDLDAGWNKFEIRSAEAYPTCQWLIDRYRFETVLPDRFGLPPPKALTIVIR